MIVTKIIKAYQENGFIEVDGQNRKKPTSLSIA